MKSNIVTQSQINQLVIDTLTVTGYLNSDVCITSMDLHYFCEVLEILRSFFDGNFNSFVQSEIRSHDNTAESGLISIVLPDSGGVINIKYAERYGSRFFTGSNKRLSIKYRWQQYVIRQALITAMESNIGNNYAMFQYTNIGKFYKGVYKHLPDKFKEVYYHCPWYHYPHISTIDDFMIAYFQSPGKEKATKIAPGRYFRRTLPHKTDREIQEMSEDFIAIQRAFSESNKMKVCEGATEDDFEYAYNSDVESCMKVGKERLSDCEYHPARAYASGAFKVYWIEQHGEVKARAIVSTLNDAFWSVYPKDGNGNPEGEAAEYLYSYLVSKYSRKKEWARGGILKIFTDSDRVPLPYVDKAGGLYYDVDNDCIIIDPDHSSITSQIYHLTDASDVYDRYFVIDVTEEGGGKSHTCELCEERVSGDNISTESIYDRGTVEVCSSCLEDYVYSPKIGSYIYSEEAVMADDINEYVPETECYLMSDEYYYDYVYVYYETSYSITEGGEKILADDAMEDWEGNIFHEDQEHIEDYCGEYLVTNNPSYDGDYKKFREGSWFSGEYFPANKVSYDLYRALSSTYTEAYTLIDMFGDDIGTLKDFRDNRMVQVYSTMDGIVGELMWEDEVEDFFINGEGELRTTEEMEESIEDLEYTVEDELEAA